MNSGKITSVEELQLVGQFETLRKTLLAPEYVQHLDKPLAHWAMPTDRRLPLAFLGRTLGSLLAVSFGELSRTPGIGQKKLASLVKLLARAANTPPKELAAEVAAWRRAADGAANAPRNNGFDPAHVSEVVWEHWRASVVRHGLAREKLGRFAATLRDMTRVIWNRTLGEYAGYTLDEIRRLRTHGEKRVRAVLGVFHSVHSVIAQMGTQEHLVVRILPRRIDQAETWIGHALQSPHAASTAEIREHLVVPLLEQIRADASAPIVRVAEARLGIGGPITSVRQVARQMELTRARVYQLLNEINDIMVVRWPNGRHLVYGLLDKLQADAATMTSPPDLQQLIAAIELFYPGSRRGAAGPVAPNAAAETAASSDTAETADQPGELVGVE